MMLFSPISCRIVVCFNIQPQIVKYPEIFWRNPILCIFHSVPLADELKLPPGFLPVRFKREAAVICFKTPIAFDCLHRSLFGPFPLASFGAASKYLVSHGWPVSIAPESHPLWFRVVLCCRWGELGNLRLGIPQY